VPIVSLCGPVRSTGFQSNKQALQQGFTSRRRCLLQIPGQVFVYLKYCFYSGQNRLTYQFNFIIILRIYSYVKLFFCSDGWVSSEISKEILLRCRLRTDRKLV